MIFPSDEAEVLAWAAERAELSAIRELADAALARLVKDKEDYDMQMTTAVLIAPRKERDHIIHKFSYREVHPGWFKPMPQVEEDKEDTNAGK